MGRRSRSRRPAASDASAGVGPDERSRDGPPDGGRVGRRERAHVPARLEAPRPEVVDAGRARRRHSRLEVGDLRRRQAEARDPELRADAVAGRGAGQQTGEPVDEGAGRLAEDLPVGIGGEGVEAGERRDRVPVGDALGAVEERQQADRAPPAPRRDVRDETGEEVEQRGLAEGGSPGGRAGGQLLAGLLAEEPAARVAAAAEAAVGRCRPVRLVPEDEVDARLEHGVRPAPAEVPVVGVVEARRRRVAAVVEHLARVRPSRDEGALRLAAEGAAEAPGARLHREPGGVGGGDDLGDRAAVVGEVVLRDRVQDGRVAEAREGREVARGMPRDADTEVGAADAHRRGSVNRFRGLVKNWY